MASMLCSATRCGSILALVLTLGPSGAWAQTSATPSRAPVPTSHQKGARPREPQDRLPDAAPLPAPDQRARHAIADGPTADELEQGPADAELLALRDAERVLFSEQLPGAMNGWSFEMPE